MGYEQSTGSKKRLTGLVIAILFHIALIYGLINGLATDMVKKVQKTLDVSIIQEVKLPPPPPPPPPPPKEAPKEKPIEKPKAYVPPVEVEVKPSTTSQDTIASVTTSEPTAPVVEPAKPQVVAPPPPPPPPPKVKVKTKASPIPGCNKPQYPAESLDNEEEGTVELSFTIAVDGSVIDGKVAKSSGFKRLDEAAKTAFEQCKFNPATVDGEPVQAAAIVPFEWKLSR